MPDLLPAEIVGDALSAWVRSMGGDPAWLRPYGAARVVLNALSAAGLLLPEGGQTRTEWGPRCFDPTHGGGLFVHEEMVCQSPVAGYGATRVVREWPGGSSFTGPWVAVDPEEKP